MINEKVHFVCTCTATIFISTQTRSTAFLEAISMYAIINKDDLKVVIPNSYLLETHMLTILESQMYIGKNSVSD